MNKNFIVIAALILAVLTLSLAGYAYAQGQPPPPSDYHYGPDMMDGYSGHDYGMMGYGYGMMGWDGEEGPMHESMIDSLAESLDLSPQEIEARHDAGESLWEIAEAEGLSDEEIRELMFSSHDAALENAEINDWLTPEQSDWMNEHMNQMWDGDYDHCGEVSGDETGVHRHGMNW
jgi:Spy/CpxP family protein refolding chaperone